jgi:phosphoribosylformylglycinamidine synthase
LLEELASALTDPAIQEYVVDGPLKRGFDWLVEVGMRPGVTDNVGRTATEAASLLLGAHWPAGARVFTSKQYLISGELVRSEVETIATGLLGNPLINRHTILNRHSAIKLDPVVPRVKSDAEPTVETVDLEISDKELKKLSRERTMALSLEEMHTIRDHYRSEDTRKKRADKGLPEQPTDIEIEALAQTWSEHCKHKIFNSRIVYREPGAAPEEINSLFKTYIEGATKSVRSKLGFDDFCLSVFVDNAGVWKFDDDWSLVFKVETHNSPSALDPYGGALTGIVGVNRDPHGTGQGSRLFCNTDVLPMRRCPKSVMAF